jgi:hypothetical protein
VRRVLPFSKTRVLYVLVPLRNDESMQCFSQPACVVGQAKAAVVGDLVLAARSLTHTLSALWPSHPPSLVVPAGQMVHGWHAVPCALTKKKPVSQAAHTVQSACCAQLSTVVSHDEHELLPTPLLRPAGHCSQELAAVAPGLVL